MRKRSMVMIAMIAAAVAVSSDLFSQTSKGPPPAPSAHPDLSGVWAQGYQPRDLKNPKGPGTMTTPTVPGGKPPVTGGYGFLDFSMEQPSMLPWAEAFFKAVNRNKRDPYVQPLIPLDPRQNCIPNGIPSAFDGHDTFELIHLPDRVLMLFARNAQHRQIWMDGRKHPGEGSPLFFMGHSIGWWEGDTLVVDTVDINPLNWIDRLGHPQTDALHVVERYRRVKPDWLEIEFLFDDPKAYKKPWKGKKIFFLRPNAVIAEQFMCEDIMLEEYPTKVKELIGLTAEPQ